MKKPTIKSTKKLKIAFVLDDGLDTEDGVQQYIKTLGNWLVKQGHDVHFLVGETSKNNLANIYSIPKNIKVSFSGNKLTIPLYSSKSKIKTILNANKYDVIHVQVPHSPIFGARVVSVAKKLLPNSVIVGTFHIAPYNFMSKYGGKGLGMYLKRNTKKFDGFVSVSTAGQKFASEAFGIRSQVIPNAVDIQKFKPGRIKVLNKKLEIVFVGRLVKRKGCQQLVEALHIINQDYRDIDYRLTVCGKGPLMKELVEAVERYDLSDKVVFKGFVSETEKIEQLQSCDIAIFPSYAGESFGIVLIEAMAARSGVVLGGKNPGYETVLNITPNCILDVLDTQLFAAQLYNFMSKKSVRSKAGIIQHKAVKQYDIQLVGSKILSFYEDCKMSKNKT